MFSFCNKVDISGRDFSELRFDWFTASSSPGKDESLNLKSSGSKDRVIFLNHENVISFVGRRFGKLFQSLLIVN